MLSIRGVDTAVSSEWSPPGEWILPLRLLARPSWVRVSGGWVAFTLDAVPTSLHASFSQQARLIWSRSITVTSS